MRTYIVLVLIIVGMMGAYFALLPLTAWSDVNTGITGAGPG
jgi:hypothetical protein